MVQRRNVLIANFLFTHLRRSTRFRRFHRKHFLPRCDLLPQPLSWRYVKTEVRKKNHLYSSVTIGVVSNSSNDSNYIFVFVLYLKITSHVNCGHMKSYFCFQSDAASEDPGASEEKGLGRKIFDAYVRTADVATTLFPLWTVLFSAAALKSPASFAWFTTEYFTAALAALMLSMGITLTPQDFLDVMKEPVSVAMQFSLCYAMMPALALGLGKLFGLDSAMLAGMVLVGSINGGQASNLCTYIARGNVALSVLMTTATTLGAIFMTPLICKSLLGAVVPVDAVGIAFSTIQVVLAPIAIGMATNKFFPNFVKKILPITPVIGVLSTCLLVASAVAQVTEPIMNAGLQLQVCFRYNTFLLVLFHFSFNSKKPFFPFFMNSFLSSSCTCSVVL